jgi:hypothetical protein
MENLKAGDFVYTDKKIEYGILKTGRQYEVSLVEDGAFLIILEGSPNRLLCLKKGCFYLDGGNWNKVKNNLKK